MSNSLKEFEGSNSSSFSEKITEDRIKLFCQATFAEPSNTAPPAFLTVFRAGEFELVKKAGLQLTSVLHGGQEYSYESEIQAGDEVRFQTHISSVLEKNGSAGRLSFVVLDTAIEVTSPKARKIGTSKTTFVVREAKS